MEPGRPPRAAGIGIHDGRVVAVGDLDESGRVVIDADGLTVAPGFVDLHSHYDAQVFWDTALTRRASTASPPWSAGIAGSRWPRSRRSIRTS